MCTQFRGLTKGLDPYPYPDPDPNPNPNPLPMCTQFRGLTKGLDPNRAISANMWDWFGPGSLTDFLDVQVRGRG